MLTASVVVMVRRVYTTDADIYISSTFSPVSKMVGSLLHVKNFSLTQRECRPGESLVEIEGNNSTQETDSICVEGNRTVTELDVQRNLARKHFFTAETATYGCNNLLCLFKSHIQIHYRVTGN